MSNLRPIEKVPGKDYSAGWKRYGFAAPFSKQENVVEPLSTEVELIV